MDLTLFFPINFLACHENDDFMEAHKNDAESERKKEIQAKKTASYRI